MEVFWETSANDCFCKKSLGSTINPVIKIFLIAMAVLISHDDMMTSYDKTYTKMKTEDG